MKELRTKGLFTPNDSVTVMLTGGTFDLFDGQCDGQNLLHILFARQRNVFEGPLTPEIYCAIAILFYRVHRNCNCESGFITQS